MTSLSRCSLAFLLSLLVSTTASAEVIERVVAVVNDEAIFLSELRRRASPFLRAIVEQVPAGQRKEQFDMVYSRVMSQLVYESLIDQKASELGIRVTGLEVEQALSNVRKQNNLEEAQFWSAVQEQGFTEQQYRDDVRQQLLRLKVINQTVRSRVNVTEAAIRDAYDDMVRKARRAQRFRAAHVLVPLPQGASATEVAQAQRKALSLRAQLTAENFEVRASELGGGDLGWLNQGDLPTELEDALLDLSEGELSPPVRGPSGLHVFLLKERASGDQQLPTFEESKGSLEQELVGHAMQRQEGIFLDQLRRDAVIEQRR